MGEALASLILYSGGGSVAYDESNLTTVKQIKALATLNKNQHEVLNSRIDAQVTASTDSDSDYAAEVVDARVDAWANENSSLGKNIRDGQTRLSQNIQDFQNSFQAQLDDEANARLAIIADGVEAHERRKVEILTEEELRVDDDDYLQNQIDTLANAVLYINLQLSDIREKLRN